MAYKSEVIKCSVCGNNFLPIRGGNRYCSADCRYKMMNFRNLFHYRYKYYPEESELIKHYHIHEQQKVEKERQKAAEFEKYTKPKPKEKVLVYERVSSSAGRWVYAYK